MQKIMFLKNESILPRLTLDSNSYACGDVASTYCATETSPKKETEIAQIKSSAFRVPSV